MWGATGTYQHPESGHHNFNPRPPCGGRLLIPVISSSEGIFQSTPPVWGATETAKRPPAFRGISIHAPRVGGDSAPQARAAAYRPISIHAPRVGGDHILAFKTIKFQVFQSTPPVWGATPPGLSRGAFPINFNPRPPCGGRRDFGFFGYFHLGISIHAPRVGGDIISHKITS